MQALPNFLPNPKYWQANPFRLLRDQNPPPPHKYGENTGPRKETWQQQHLAIYTLYSIYCIIISE
jgi:hypothetical protein